MKTSILLAFALVLLVFTTPGDASVQEDLHLTVNIHPHATLEVQENIAVDVERPWQGEKRSTSSGLRLRCNDKVNLHWESTVFADGDRVLPLHAEDAPFGMTVGLQAEWDDTLWYRSVSRDDETLQSAQDFAFDPGTWDFRIVMTYGWLSDREWEEILAGSYSGVVTFTVSEAD